MVERAARAAGFDIKIHPHMLRHTMSELLQFIFAVDPLAAGFTGIVGRAPNPAMMTLALMELGNLVMASIVP
jgi:hypothetical protein